MFSADRSVCHGRIYIGSVMSQVLQNKVAVVTGGTSGIGLAIAKRFVAEGAHVFITGRRQPELDAAIAAIGSSVTGVRADSSRLSDLDALYEQVATQAGHVDIVVANAGGGQGASLEQLTEGQFDSTFGTNVKGVVFTVQKALPLLAPDASVILIGSSSSLRPGPNMSLYAASKAAVRSLARSWIIDLQNRGVRVNVLTPGPTLTPGLAGMAPEEHREAMLAGIASRVPLGRLGDPDEIATAAVFLASSAASFVHGAELFADGGQAQN
jgi:NAD(P)-dependent dehydrogenase (short-subunit alcohol dehydrogenase family)